MGNSDNLFRQGLVRNFSYVTTHIIDIWVYQAKFSVGETGASCYRGRLLQGHFMQNYYVDGEIADSSSILIHQGNY